MIEIQLQCETNIRIYERTLQCQTKKQMTMNTADKIKSGFGAAAGTATAVGGHAAAMGIATTFGTASTGTAISTLSGAPATNAATAWLGGGALAAGGGGMAAGSIVLATIPIVGVTLATGALGYGIYKYCKSKKSEKL